LINSSVDTEGIWSVTFSWWWRIAQCNKNSDSVIIFSRISADAYNCQPVKLSIAPTPSSTPESSSIFTSGVQCIFLEPVPDTRHQLQIQLQEPLEE